MKPILTSITIDNLTPAELEQVGALLRRLRNPGPVALDNFDPPPDEGPGGNPPN